MDDFTNPTIPVRDVSNFWGSRQEIAKRRNVPSSKQKYRFDKGEEYISRISTAVAMTRFDVII